jgi:hypothetical protein
MHPFIPFDYVVREVACDWWGIKLEADAVGFLSAAARQHLKTGGGGAA